MTWLRRNRWWLPLIPVAVVLLVAASGHRLQDWWWNTDYRTQIDHAPSGEWAHWEDINTFSDKGAERSFDVRLVRMERVDEVPNPYGDPQPLPSGSQGVLVELEFRKPVGDSTGCRMILVADDGGYYGDWFSEPLRQDTCGPADYGNDPDATWTATSVIPVDPGAKIAEVRIGFNATDYLTLDPPA